MNKNEPIILDPIFSKPIYGKFMDVDTKKVVSMIDNWGWQTTDYWEAGELMPGDWFQVTKNWHILDHPKLKFLRDEIMKEFYLYAHGVMKYVNEFEITTSWFTKAAKNQNCQYHLHNNCMITGTLYLQTNENSGDISFQDYNNRRFDLVVDEANVYNALEWHIKPSDGLLIFFPSELYHKIEKNKTDSPRYSLAFNMTPIGQIGRKYADSQVSIKVEK